MAQLKKMDKKEYEKFKQWLDCEEGRGYGLGKCIGRTLQCCTVVRNTTNGECCIKITLKYLIDLKASLECYVLFFFFVVFFVFCFVLFFFVLV